MNSIENAIGGAMTLKARIVNLGEMAVRDIETGKDQIIKITIVAEPQVFGKTIFSTDEEVKSITNGDGFTGAMKTSSVIEQLKHFENIQ